MDEIISKSTSKETLLYLYILGQGNRENYLRGVVPYCINNEELFYGACEKHIRREIKSLWEERRKEKDKLPKIYLVGINPSPGKKEYRARKILFAGEVLEIFTFREAWDHYDQIIHSSLNDDYKNEVKKMRRGIRKDEGVFESPLHLEPILNNEGLLIGYKHRTNMHKHGNKWLNDILSDSERNLFNKTNDEKYPKEIYKNEKISFERDCCFKLKNIHFSSKKKQCPIDLTNETFELIKPTVHEKRPSIRLNKLREPDISSPFGYNKVGNKHGLGVYIALRNEKAEEFINLLINEENNLGEE